MKIDRKEAIQWISDLHPGAIYVVCNAFCNIAQGCNNTCRLRVMVIGQGLWQKTGHK